MRNIICLLISFCFLTAHGQQTPFEKSSGISSVTYEQLIRFYERLDEKYKTIKLEEAGPSDADHPLQVVYYSSNGRFDVKQWKADRKMILLINNGIHPGEPDGIDASMMLLRNAASGEIKIPENVVLAVIPVFNIGGMLNRGSYSRASQNGPLEFGFRGNSENLDLNRDFMKMDARETQSLVKLFHKLNPDLFIDNHVSNGADYQHVMTLLSTQRDKLGIMMGDYMSMTIEPLLYKSMQQKGYDLVPYVNHWGHTPDKGWIAFYEGPRFASGFAALFHTYAFVPETHMLKPYKQRVNATYELMRSFITIASENATDIRMTRKVEKAVYAKQTSVTIAWQSDTSAHRTITFKGYEAGYKPSEVSGKPRLYYDRSKPYTKQVPYYDVYVPKLTATVPKAYIVPHGWNRVTTRLRANGVKMQVLDKDSLMKVTAYYIDNYETSPKPYEGHYLHSNIKVHTTTKTIQVYKGDYIVVTNQSAKRYIMEALDPTAPDGFFAWGFFDAVLQQKEGYSDYVFEDEAAYILKQDANLKRQLEQRRKADTAFAKNGEAQLDFVYQKSNYFEPVYMRYPVYKLEYPPLTLPEGGGHVLLQ